MEEFATNRPRKRLKNIKPKHTTRIGHNTWNNGQWVKYSEKESRSPCPIFFILQMAQPN